MSTNLNIDTASETLSASKVALDTFETFIKNEDLDFSWDDVEFDVTFLEESGLDRGDAIEILRELSNSGVGKFVYGRRGHNTRLQLKIDSDEAEEIILRAKDLISKSPKKKTFKDDSLEVSFFLRQDFELITCLPKNFNRQDAERLKRWIDTLPFD